MSDFPIRPPDMCGRGTGHAPSGCADCRVLGWGDGDAIRAQRRSLGRYSIEERVLLPLARWIRALAAKLDWFAVRMNAWALRSDVYRHPDRFPEWHARNRRPQ